MDNEQRLRVNQSARSEKKHSAWDVTLRLAITSALLGACNLRGFAKQTEAKGTGQPVPSEVTPNLKPENTTTHIPTKSPEGKNFTPTTPKIFNTPSAYWTPEKFTPVPVSTNTPALVDLTETATQTATATLAETATPDPIFQDFVKYGYDKQFKEGLGFVNNEQGSYQVQLTKVGPTRYDGRFKLNNLEVNAYVPVAWFDKDGNQQEGILPLSYLNNKNPEDKDFGQYYLLGLGFDPSAHTPFFAEKFLRQIFESYILKENQIFSAYFDSTETTSEGLANFLKDIPALPEEFVTTGDASKLLDIPGAPRPVLPVTSLGLVQ